MPEPIEQINEIEQESPKQENKRQTKNSLLVGTIRYFFGIT